MKIHFLREQRDQCAVAKKKSTMSDESLEAADPPPEPEMESVIRINVANGASIIQRYREEREKHPLVEEWDIPKIHKALLQMALFHVGMFEQISQAVRTVPIAISLVDVRTFLPIAILLTADPGSMKRYFNEDLRIIMFTRTALQGARLLCLSERSIVAQLNVIDVIVNAMKTAEGLVWAESLVATVPSKWTNPHGSATLLASQERFEKVESKVQSDLSAGQLGPLAKSFVKDITNSAGMSSSPEPSTAARPTVAPRNKKRPHTLSPEEALAAAYEIQIKK